MIRWLVEGSTGFDENAEAFLQALNSSDPTSPRFYRLRSHGDMAQNNVPPRPFVCSDEVSLLGGSEHPKNTFHLKDHGSMAVVRRICNRGGSLHKCSNLRSAHRLPGKRAAKLRKTYCSQTSRYYQARDVSHLQAHLGPLAKSASA